ncbi:MAG: GNAT family N-acetyltransferase [Bacteroidia bacterium]|nr:GNAT family N-acetyltransferase [Bacteroidia bacterium]
MTQILQTERLVLREFNIGDTAFVVELLNSEGWLKYIGNRNINNVDDALHYLENSILSAYTKLGFGLWLVELKNQNMAIGMCGFIKRDTLDYEDLGFAFLPQYHSKGYATEAALATLQYGRMNLNLKQVLAITTITNEASIKLLTKIGFGLEKRFYLPGETEELFLFRNNLTAYENSI